MVKQCTRTSNAIFNLGYHIVWCPKYRKGFLLGLNQTFLRRIFDIAAIKVRGKIENIEVMPDHVHIFLRLKQNHIAVAKIVQILKGYSSFSIRQRYIWMKKYKALWSSGYFIESVGNMSERVIKKYIDNQKIAVKPNYKYKELVDKQKSLKTISINYNQRNIRRRYEKDNCTLFDKSSEFSKINYQIRFDKSSDVI